MSVSQRIYLIVGLIALTAGAVALSGIVKMKQIGTELGEIAHEDMPLLEKVTAITLHQMQQAILLERMLRAAEVSEGADFTADSAAFLELAAQVDREVLEGEEIARHAMEVAHTEETRGEFERVIGILEQVESEHHDYDIHAEEIIHAVEAGDLATANRLIVEVEAEQEKLDHELQSLLLELDSFTRASTEQALADEEAGIRLMIAISIGGTLVGIVVGTLLGRGISRPVVDLSGVMKRMGEGARDEMIPHIARKDELGGMARSVSEFQDGLREADRLNAEQMAEATARARRAEERERAMQAFDATINEIVEHVASGAAQLKGAARSMNEMASNAGDQASSVASASEEVSANIQAVATSAEELSASIREISIQAASLHESSQGTREKVAFSRSRIEALAGSTEEIGEVVTLIQEIAEKTNLLALNATIEAARAGEAGKGFAVVAEEVKSLATQTAQATERISQQIQAVQGDARSAVDAVHDIGKAIETLNEVSASIASAVEEQTTATGEIAQNVEQAACGTEEVSGNITGVSGTVMETSSASDQVNSTAEDLSGRAGVLREKVETFFATLRAA